MVGEILKRVLTVTLFANGWGTHETDQVRTLFASIATYELAALNRQASLPRSLLSLCDMLEQLLLSRLFLV